MATDNNTVCLTIELKTGYNLITIPYYDPSITKASELSSRVGYNGKNVKKVLSWNASTQTYTTFIPGTPINDFNVYAGQGYSIELYNQDTITFTGEKMETSSQTFNLSVNQNLIGIPLTNPSITNASELATKIGSSVNKLLKWDTSTQKYITFIPGTPINNFNIVGGEAYFVNAKTPTTVTISGTQLSGTCTPPTDYTLIAYALIGVAAIGVGVLISKGKL